MLVSEISNVVGIVIVVFVAVLVVDRAVAGAVSTSEAVIVLWALAALVIGVGYSLSQRVKTRMEDQLRAASREARRASEGDPVREPGSETCAEFWELRESLGMNAGNERLE